MNQIFALLFIKENLRCPHTAEIVPAETHQLFLGKINKIFGFPHSQAFTARAVDLFPIHVVVFVHSVNNAKVGCDNNKAARMKSDNLNIAASPFAKLCGQYGIASVNSLPIEAVTADAETNLLAVGSQLFLEMCKEIRQKKAPLFFSSMIRKAIPKTIRAMATVTLLYR